MGLDITVYKGARPCTAQTLSRITASDAPYEEAAECEAQLLYLNPSFPGHGADMTAAAYHFESSWGFCAGSYGGYGQWRQGLAAMGKPGFGKLINFSDCEGIIGTTVCAELAVAFDAHATAATYHEGEWWQAKYDTWRRAFREAADTGGWVDFH